MSHHIIIFPRTTQETGEIQYNIHVATGKHRNFIILFRAVDDVLSTAKIQPLIEYNILETLFFIPLVRNSPRPHTPPSWAPLLAHHPPPPLSRCNIFFATPPLSSWTNLFLDHPTPSYTTFCNGNRYNLIYLFGFRPPH